MHDELDASYFAFKANDILKKKMIEIENPKNWNIPDNYQNEAKEHEPKLIYFKENSNIINEIKTQIPTQKNNVVSL